MKKSQVYTRRGDQGETDLYTGQRCKKSDLTFDVLGHIDALNVYIGAAKSDMGFPLNNIVEYLHNIQQLLISMGSCIGSLEKGKKSKRKVYFDEDAVLRVEHEINFLSSKLPKLKTFILPEGKISSKIHVCRVTTRELERKMVALSEDRDITHELKFINRLSDYFFELARYIHEYESLVEGFRNLTRAGVVLIVWGAYSLIHPLCC